jgi:hypothetical protein
MLKRQLKVTRQSKRLRRGRVMEVPVQGVMIRPRTPTFLPALKQSNVLISYRVYAQRYIDLAGTQDAL